MKKQWQSPQFSFNYIIFISFLSTSRRNQYKSNLETKLNNPSHPSPERFCSNSESPPSPVFSPTFSLYVALQVISLDMTSSFIILISPASNLWFNPPTELKKNSFRFFYLKLFDSCFFLFIFFNPFKFM